MSRPTVKVTGFVVDGVKSYRLTFQGVEYVAERDGSKFVCSGIRGTLREIKAAIASGQVGGPVVSDTGEPIVSGPKSTWDCVDPCALLVELIHGGKLEPEDVWNTLDCYGWIDPASGVDVDRAKREIGRASNEGK